ncbi:alpha/beta-hydrolase [Clavulina sp. PMI_390]|nr:alpha/beta-hydrolase [Clavulina sp. PMI_390]
MPFVPLSTPADAFEGFWISNLPDNDISLAVTNGRPTLLLPHLTRFSMPDYFHLQFSEPAFKRYNLIALDLPGWPGTKAPLLREQGDKYDEWVAAAIIGDFCLTMNLKDVHFLGVSVFSGKILPRLAALFPSIPKSISLSCVMADTPPSADLSDGLRANIDRWIHATTRQELDEIIQGEVYMWFYDNNPVDTKMLDDFTNDWRAQRIHTNALIGAMVYFTTGMATEEAELVRCPILVAQGDISHLFSPEDARQLVAHYPNAQSNVHILSGGPPVTSVTPEFAPTLHRLVISHIEHSMLASPTTTTFPKPLPHTSSETAISTDTRREKGMREAMKTYISVAPEWLKHELETRDPLSVLSFSHRSPEQVKELHERWYDRWLEMENEERPEEKRVEVDKSAAYTSKPNS